MKNAKQIDESFGLIPQIERVGMAIASCVAAAVEKAGTPEMFVLLKDSQRLTEELQQLLILIKEKEKDRASRFDGMNLLQSEDVTIAIIDLKKDGAE